MPCTCHYEGTCEGCKARHARSAQILRDMIPAGSRDSAGNKVETLIAALERASR